MERLGELLLHNQDTEGFQMTGFHEMSPLMSIVNEDLVLQLLDVVCQRYCEMSNSM